MIATQLVRDLKKQNVQLWTEDDQLRVRAPKGVLTPELQAQLSSYKKEVIRLLGEAVNNESCALPQIVSDPEGRNKPFPLTGIQQAYWVGRGNAFELGSVGCHAYYEVDSKNLDLERLERAWQRLIERHDMLRAIVLPDGQQQVLERVPDYKIELLDLCDQSDADAASQLELIRERMSHQVLQSDQWPLFEIRASRLDDERTRLHLSFDFLIVDVWSLQILFREWFELYNDSEVALDELELSFRDYVLAESAVEDSEAYRLAREYWSGRAATLPPPPELPLAAHPASLNNHVFARRSARLEPQIWKRLKNRALENGLTTSALLLAAFTEVITAWSKSPRFAINVTLLNRLPIHPQVNSIVGDFTTLLPLEVNNSAAETFAARAERLQAQLMADVEHRFASGVQVLREVARTQNRIAGAAMPIVFTSLLAHSTRSEQPAKMLWMGDVAYGITQTPQTWLDHQVFEEDDALGFNWDAVEDLFPEGFLQEMFDAYCRFLHALANDAGVWQETVRCLLPASQLAQRKAVNATEAPVPNGMLHSLFAEQVKQRPQQPAVIAQDAVLSYEELYRRANRLGHKLQRMGARPNKLVAVVMDKGWEQVAAVVGILQSGAAFLPINACTPSERLWHLLDHGEVDIVLTQSWLDESLSWPLNVARISVDTIELEETGIEALDFVQSAEDLAYVIYTSGSTGVPKGVMIDHKAAVNTIVDINDRFNVGPGDKVLALSELSFDLSIYDIFGSLACGATIVLPDSQARREPHHWTELIEKQKVTVWNSVPALLEMLVASQNGNLDGALDSLRLVMLSGDWIPLALPEKIKALAPHSSVVSLGGATEASIWSILYPVDRVEGTWKSVPYGKPMLNQRFHVLNESLEPCPVWVPGQLYIAGVGLARGYWRDEQKTNASFFNHPTTGERLYKTGDVGRYLPDGNIEFLGREDSQIKMRGHRIELGEIEAALAAHKAVKAVAVKALGKAREKERLVAYVAADVEPAPTAGDLNDFLKEKLPSYLIPSAFVILSALPLTANGKVDRNALPDPEPVVRAPLQQAKARMTPIERHIAEVVTRILEIDSVDPATNLLEVGANSIDIVKIAGSLEKDFGFRIKIEEFYCAPTVEGLAACYETQILQNKKARAGGNREAALRDKLVAKTTEVLLDPTARAEFKKRQAGLRRNDDGKPQFNLLETTASEILKERFFARRSHRQFVAQEITQARFSDFLCNLRQISEQGKSKYLYASAGGLYPVQVYLHIKQGRVEGLPGGTYYYHPLQHSLVLLRSDVELDHTIHEPFINRPVFEEAAFSIFLIAELSAITPLYGEYSMHFATLEAGLMTQLLEMAAPANRLGLCQVGGLDFGRIRHLFDLGESQVLIHSLLGGQIEDRQHQNWLPFQESYYPPNTSLIPCEEGEI